MSVRPKKTGTVEEETGRTAGVRKSRQKRCGEECRLLAEGKAFKKVWVEEAVCQTTGEGNSEKGCEQTGQVRKEEVTGRATLLNPDKPEKRLTMMIS